MSLDQPYRAAVYFAPPPDSLAWQLGSAWLGRCAQSNRVQTQPVPAGVSPETFERWTAEPRRYGWHATLKPPFRLASGRHLSQLRTELASLARQFQSFVLPELEIAKLGDFLALRPSAPSEPLQALAAGCVTQLHPYAAPLDESELARRRRAPLTPEQDALLVRWGYPWVLQQFRFHMSLTGSLKDVSIDDQKTLVQAARAHFSSYPPTVIDRLSLFVEPQQGADFICVDQWGLAA